MLPVIKILCYFISAWWVLAVVADSLYVFFHRNPTDATSYLCNPFCIIGAPLLDLKMPQGILIWLIGLGITIFTAIFFL